MILKIRIDDRLLHGQVAYSWKAKLGYDAIVIVSDEVASDELRKATIKMCAPAGVKLAIRNIDQAIPLLNDDRLKSMKVFVICPNPKTVYDLIIKLSEKPVINLGGLSMHYQAQLFSNAVYLNSFDIEYLNKLLELGYEIEVQEVPESKLYNYKFMKK